MAGISLKQFHPEVGVLTLSHPATGETWFEHPETGEPIQGIMYLCGYDSEAYSKAATQYIERRVNNTVDWTLEQSKEENKTLAAACIVGWEDNGFFTTPWSKEEALDLMTRPENVWLVVQILDFLSDRNHFFTKNSKDSESGSEQQSNLSSQLEETEQPEK